MATRTRGGGRSPGGRKGKTKAELKRLLEKARNEVEKLLQADRVGILSSKTIKARLTQLDKYLEAIEFFDEGA